jgi:hypothetical protein
VWGKSGRSLVDSHYKGIKQIGEVRVKAANQLGKTPHGGEAITTSDPSFSDLFSASHMRRIMRTRPRIIFTKTQNNTTTRRVFSGNCAPKINNNHTTR